MNELRKPSLISPLCRIGNKYYDRHHIIPYIPNHKCYVELFVGSGSIFFNKKKAESNILNDLDKSIIEYFRMLKVVSNDWTKYPELDTLLKKKKYWNEIPLTVEYKLVHEIIKFGYGFGSKPVIKESAIYRERKPLIKLKKYLLKWQDNLQDVILEEEDYADIIKKYDSIDTFFFLDPPYENTDKSFKYAQDKDFSFTRLLDEVKKINGKFLMTINDSPFIENLFKDFNIMKIMAINKFRNGRKGKDRKELLISNYELQMN